MPDFVKSLKSVIDSFEDKAKFDNNEVFSSIIELCNSCPPEHKNKEY
jgi:hypothetical protein